RLRQTTPVYRRWPPLQMVRAKRGALACIAAPPREMLLAEHSKAQERTYRRAFTSNPRIPYRNREVRIRILDALDSEIAECDDGQGGRHLSGHIELGLNAVDIERNVSQRRREG